MPKPNQSAEVDERTAYIEACVLKEKTEAAWRWDAAERAKPPTPPTADQQRRARAKYDDEEKLTEKEAAKYCKVSKGTIARWRKDGAKSRDGKFQATLPHEMAGRSPRYTKRSLDRYMAAITRHNLK